MIIYGILAVITVINVIGLVLGIEYSLDTDTRWPLHTHTRKDWLVPGFMVGWWLGGKR